MDDRADVDNVDDVPPSALNGAHRAFNGACNSVFQVHETHVCDRCGTSTSAEALYAGDIQNFLVYLDDDVDDVVAIIPFPREQLLTANYKKPQIRDRKLQQSKARLPTLSVRRPLDHLRECTIIGRNDPKQYSHYGEAARLNKGALFDHDGFLVTVVYILLSPNPSCGNQLHALTLARPSVILNQTSFKSRFLRTSVGAHAPNQARHFRQSSNDAPIIARWRLITVEPPVPQGIARPLHQSHH